MDKLEEMLKEAVIELESTTVVSGGAVAEASKQSSDLLERFRATLEMAKKANGPRRRANGKQPPVLAEAAPVRRVAGKQKHQMVIADFFTKRKGPKPGFCQAPGNRQSV